MKKIKSFIKFIRENNESPNWHTPEDYKAHQRPDSPEFISDDDELYWYWLNSIEEEDDEDTEDDD